MAARERQRGFTLGEVLSAMAIVGVSLSLVAPSLNSAVASNQRARAVNELVATLHTAHSVAITRNRQVTVCPSTDGRQCATTRWDSGWLQFVDEDRNGRVSPGEEILDTVGTTAPFQVHSEEFREFLAYLPSGRVTGGGSEGYGGRFQFCLATEPGQNRVIQVGATGFPQLLPADGAGFTSACPEIN